MKFDYNLSIFVGCQKSGCAIFLRELFQYISVCSEVSFSCFWIAEALTNMLISSSKFEILRSFISSEVKSLAEKAAPLLGLGAGSPPKRWVVIDGSPDFFLMSRKK